MVSNFRSSWSLFTYLPGILFVSLGRYILSFHVQSQSQETRHQQPPSMDINLHSEAIMDSLAFPFLFFTELISISSILSDRKRLPRSVVKETFGLLVSRLNSLNIVMKKISQDTRQEKERTWEKDIKMQYQIFQVNKKPDSYDKLLIVEGMTQSWLKDTSSMEIKKDARSFKFFASISYTRVRRSNWPLVF